MRGNLAPDGCVLKTVAAEKRLLNHRGPALVFDNYAQLKAQINSPDLPVTADTVLILRSAGPLGAPGFPEWGMLPIPQKLLAAGVRDMVRISDARYERHQLRHLHPACIARKSLGWTAGLGPKPET